MIPYWITPAGAIPAATETKYYIYLLSFKMIPPGRCFVVSGSLPKGLTLGNDGSITGVPTPVARTMTYSFSIRIENEDGIADRSFTMEVKNESPVWVTPSVIVQNIPPEREYRNRQVIEYQFVAKDTGDEPITYTLVGGTIPQGTTLREDGVLIGYIQDVGATFLFTIRANTSEPIEKTFQMVVVDDVGNRVPYWSTLTGWIGDIYESQTVSFWLTGADSDPGDTVQFELASGSYLPQGLSMTSDGHIFGVLNVAAAVKSSFDVLITDGEFKVRRKFFFRCNFSVDQGDIWIIPPINPVDPGLLGSLQQDEASYYTVQAVNTSQWVKYEISSGELPPGLVIMEDTGHIVGSITTDAQTKRYNFTIRAHNDLLLEDFIALDIIVTINSNIRKNRVSTIITGEDRMKMFEVYMGGKIPPELVYRPDDYNFGLSMSNELRIKRYVDFNDKLQLFKIVEGKPYTTARPQGFRMFPVLNSRGERICEAVVIMFLSDNEGGVSSTRAPVTSLNLIRDGIQTTLNAPRGAFEKWHTDKYTTNIRSDTFISNNHDLYTGKIVYMVNQNVPSPFLNDIVYYAIVVDKNTYRLAMTYNDAMAGEYIRFNINDTDRAGYYYTHHNAIPVVYTKVGDGNGMATRLNSMMRTDYALTLRWLTWGPTATRYNRDMEMMVFDGGTI